MWEQINEVASRYPKSIAKKRFGDYFLFDYLYSDFEMFFNDPLTRECRGIIFKNGEIASRPIPKVWNWKENLLTDIPVSEFYGYYSEKLDGSMLQVSVHEGNLIYASRSSMSGMVNEAAQRIFEDNPSYIDAIRKHPNLTWGFEYLSSDPSKQIVMGHEKEQVVLTYLRNKSTGVIVSAGYLLDKPGLSSMFPFSVNPMKVLTPEIWEEQVWKSLNSKRYEGEMIHLYNGQVIIKVKTDWYLDLHKFYQLSDRTIVQFYLENKADDIIANLFQRGLPHKAKEILLVVEIFEKRVRDLVDSGRKAYGLYRGSLEDRKQFYLHISSLVEPIVAASIMKSYPNLDWSKIEEMIKGLVAKEY